MVYVNRVAGRGLGHPSEVVAPSSGAVSPGKNVSSLRR